MICISIAYVWYVASPSAQKHTILCGVWSPMSSSSSACLEVPLRDGSGAVALPLGTELPLDTEHVLDLLRTERPRLSLWVSLGAEYYVAGKVDQAVAIFDAAEAAGNTDDELRRADEHGFLSVKVALGTHYLRMSAAARKENRTAEADEFARRAQDHTTFVANADLNFELGWLAEGLRLLDQATVETVKSATGRFEAALDLTGNKSLVGRLGKACCEFYQGNLELARINYAEALKNHPDCSPSVRVGLAHCLYKLGDVEMAERAFLRARELDPSNAQAAIGLAILRMNRSKDTADPENVQASMHLLRDAYVDDNVNAMALNHLANHFFWRGELDRVKDFGINAYNSTTHDGMRAESLLLLARAHHREGDYVRAKARYHDAQKAFEDQNRKNKRNHAGSDTPPPVLLLVGLGQMDLVDGNVEGAVAKFSDAIKRVPDCKELMLILGALHKSSRKGKKSSSSSSSSSIKLSRTEAVKFLKQATDLDSGNVDAQIEMAELVQGVGTDQHYKQALKHYKKGERAQIMAGEPTPSQIHNNVGVLHFQLGDLAQATAALKRALKTAGSGGPAGEAGENGGGAGGEGEEHEGGPEDAGGGSEDAVTVASDILGRFGARMYRPNMITLTYNVARLFEQMGATEPAREIYDRLMANPQEVEAILKQGAERLRPQSTALLEKVRHAVGAHLPRRQRAQCLAHPCVQPGRLIVPERAFQHLDGGLVVVCRE